MHLHKYQINLCPAEPRYILFLETTDQLIRIYSFAFSFRSCQNLAIFAQQYRVKDKDYCPIEIIKGLTDKGQFQYLTKLMGPQEGTYLYATQFHSLR